MAVPAHYTAHYTALHCTLWEKFYETSIRQPQAEENAKTIAWCDYGVREGGEE